MKKWILVISLIVATTLSSGFLGAKKDSKAPKAKKETKAVQPAKTPDLKKPLLLSVDFEPNKTLVYNFVSERSMDVDLDPTGKYSKGGKQEGKEQTQVEKLEMQIAYKPIKVDPLGVSIIQATCNSAKVTRTGTGRAQDKADAVESLAGQSYTISISPAGKIVDYTSLDNTAKTLAEKAFGGGETKKGKVKNPDMIMDFMAMQWNTWNSTASLKNPTKGINKKSVWTSKLLAPMPFVSKTARDVKYSLAGVQKDGNDTVANIASEYTLSKTPMDITLPYSGSFQMKGMFGFLQGYKVLSIDGKGTQLFDVDKGRIISDKQQYTAAVKASIFGLGSDELTPNIKIDQKITITLVK